MRRAKWCRPSGAVPVAASPVARRRRFVACVAAASALFSAGCGGIGAEGFSDAASMAEMPRPAAGIAAAGGVVDAERGCAADAAPVVVAWVGPDLDQLAEVGLQTLDLEDPTLIVAAYVDAVNHGGGIAGRCFDLVSFEWDMTDRDASFRGVCRDLPSREPVVLLSFSLNAAALRCATVAAEIPTLGIHVSLPAAAAGGGALFLGDGSREHLLSSALNVAADAGIVNSGDRVGLITNAGAAAGAAVTAGEDTAEVLRLYTASAVRVPAEFGTVGAEIAERQVRLMETGLSESETRDAVEQFSRLEAAQVDVLREMETFFDEAVDRLRSDGVSAVVASSSPADARRMMRSAEKAGWHPLWILTDAQPAALTLTRAPQAQARNVVQISSRRAAGDPVGSLDRDCASLRNTFSEADPFRHRVHSDAWGLLAATCDHLDIVFAAASRAGEGLSRGSLAQELAMTDYETAHGGRIVFGAADRDGAERFRVLEADPFCVLNQWGCMRAITEWASLPDLDSLDLS